jgi:hypothetical protein
MSRKPTIANENSIKLLKEFIRKKSNLGCTSFNEIQQLQFKIKKDTNEYISNQTLNRFFGLIKNNFKPAAATLNVLAKYVQYNSFKDFELLNTQEQSQSKSLKSCKLVLSLFSDVHASNKTEEGILDIFKNMCTLIEKNPDMIPDVYPFMARSDIGREYFFKQLINIDALNSHYGDGLNYFLLNTNNREDHLFAYTLLCFRYFLTNQPFWFDHYFEKINQYKLDEIRSFHPFLLGRYYATCVFKNVIDNKPININPETLESFNRIDRTKFPYAAFPKAEYIFGLSLLLAQEYSLSWEVLQMGSRYLKNIPIYMDKSFVTQYELLQLYAGYCSTQISKKRATEQLKGIQEKSFYLLSTELFSILV